MIRAGLILGAILAICAACYGAYYTIDQRGYERGKAACMAERQDTANKVQAETDRRDERSADAHTTMLDYLATQKPAIEIRTHDTIERVRTLYRDAPATVCTRADGVQAELDAARDRANAAIGPV